MIFLRDQCLTNNIIRHIISVSYTHLYDSDTLLSGGSGGSGSPYVVQERVPEVVGVLVLAEGAEKATVKTEITEAVQALFPLEVHKIRVLKRGS